ncbi:MAG: flagellar filament capping protein FliD [Holophagaceae bacterium]|nr:flagellar filament capping protein FliD [Holophagaceae bacterium]
MADTTNSLSGISSGIDTNALINAIVAMKSGNMNRLQAQKDLNDKKTTALQAMRTGLQGLSLSLTILYDKLNNRTVTSTDTNNTNVVATATGSASGNYDIQVSTVATKGRISSTLDANGLATNMAVASPMDTPIFSGATAQFAIQGTDGKVATITLDASSNNLNGLRDKINAQTDTGVTATIVNTGKGTNRYQLVLTAKETGTGTGTTQGNVTIADITSGDGVTAVNSLGIFAGTVDNPTTPTSITGGLTSTMSGAAATDAKFTLNGVEITRTSNVVKDAAEGMTFTLKQGGQTGITTLTVTADKVGSTAAIQDVITKYNQLVKDYKAASTATKNEDGTIALAPLSNDASTRTLMADLKKTMSGASAGMPEDSAYKSLASLGITTLADGGLILNTSTFQTAVSNDLSAVKRLFSFSGTSTSQAVSFKSAGTATLTGTVGFEVTRNLGDNTLWGTLTQLDAAGNPVGAPSNPIQVGADGTLVGTGDFAGLNLSVTGTGTGRLSLTRGAAQQAIDLLTGFTGTTGTISTTLTRIVTQNNSLASQIGQAQTRLNQEKEILKKKFAQMEVVVGRMKASAGSLSGL